MKIHKPTIRGIQPFAGDTTTPTCDWADSSYDWDESTVQWGAAIGYEKRPRIGDVRLDTPHVGEANLQTPRLKHD